MQKEKFLIFIKLECYVRALLVSISRCLIKLITQVENNNYNKHKKKKYNDTKKGRKILSELIQKYKKKRGVINE